MKEIKNEKISDKLIQIKRFIIEQLTCSKDFNLEYKLCLDFLRNYKEEKYKEMMIERTKKTVIELYKYATTVVSSVNHWIYSELLQLTDHQQADLLNNENKMNDFLYKIHDFIRSEYNDSLLFSGKRC